MASRGMMGIIAAVSCALVSCSLLVDLHDLTSDASDATSSDAAIDGPTAPASDSSALDAAMSSGMDATSNADASVRFCASQTHAFCADFDDGLIGSQWTGTQVGANGGLAVSSAQSVSPKMSMHATIARRAAGDIEEAIAYASLPGAWRRTVVEMDVFAEVPAWQTGDVNCSLLEFDFTNNGTRNAFYVVLANGYGEASGPGFDMSVDPFPVGAWVHLKFDYQPNGTFSYTLNSKTFVASGTALTGPGTEVDLAVGVDGYNAPVPAFSVFYDNVTVDFP